MKPGTYSSSRGTDGGDHPLAWASVGVVAPLRPAFQTTCDNGDSKGNSGSITSTSSHPTNYCAWKENLMDCLTLLQRDLSQTKSWVFVGSPEMATLTYYVSMQWKAATSTTNNVNGNEARDSGQLSQHDWNITTRRNSCQNLLYLGIPPPQSSSAVSPQHINDHGGWTIPNHQKGEGPVNYGKQNPWCMDCLKCWNVLLSPLSSAASTPTSTSTSPPSLPLAQELQYLEYLAVEYARDVSVPSVAGNTTQETTAYYLRSKRPQVCVLHTGMLDATIPFVDTTSSDSTMMPDAIFHDNMGRFISLLQRSCSNVIWVTLHAVVESDEIVQTNCQLRRWNNGVLEFLERNRFNNVYIVDVWEKSLRTDFVTNLKVGKKFYSQLARLFVAVMLI
jgi:hypothetical protein